MSTLVLTIGLATIAGCAQQDSGTSAGATPQTSNVPATTGATTMFPLDFSRTGGIAGLDDHVHIDPDGTMTVAHKGNTAQPVQLGAPVLAALEQVLPAESPKEPSAKSAICADGFVYQLTTPAWTYTADDCSGNSPDLEHALDVLMPMLQGKPVSPASPS
ncbi:hypothetical protein [Actinoplanes sp. L3-i22]|uniref:hypothetical protein n=1 Tax=Actinoplanes sp. L3-i22 TaxID=2836373 RepID=UPI001C75C39D|nr:hypothetical protein [Actinoplanes sp. L3-i22]BCY09577.1 hypothetical protein L3i22_046650 [Actinoplanes sp. L3-i22]